MTEQVQKPPYGTMVLAHVALSLVYALTLSPLTGVALAERVADGFGFLSPALLVGCLMARSAAKKGNAQPMKSGLTGVFVVAGLIMGFFWLS